MSFTTVNDLPDVCFEYCGLQLLLPCHPPKKPEGRVPREQSETKLTPSPNSLSDWRGPRIFEHNPYFQPPRLSRVK